MSRHLKTREVETPIAVSSLRKAFGKQVVLDGIDLNVAEGETVAVLGQSGSGKSVLLKLLIGLQAPDAGSICVLGQEITHLTDDRLNEVRKKVGFLFQQAALYDSLTVEQNVEFPMSRHIGMSAEQRAGRARQLLASVGMEKDLSKMPSEISGGMQKRVGLARALALDPELLLLDEPTAGLDPITGADIARLVVKLRKQRRITSVVVTHDMAAARIFADRLVLLRDGKILVEGSFEDLQQSHDKFIARFLGEAA